MRTQKIGMCMWDGEQFHPSQTVIYKGVEYCRAHAEMLGYGRTSLRPTTRKSTKSTAPKTKKGKEKPNA